MGVDHLIGMVGGAYSHIFSIRFVITIPGQGNSHPGKVFLTNTFLLESVIENATASGIYRKMS